MFVRPAIGIACSALLACASAPPPHTAAPAPTEIVVDEALVVHAGPGVPAIPAAPGALPALPIELAATSPAFQRGFALAQPLLDAAPPSAAPDDATAYAAWLEADFKPWVQARAGAVSTANTALGESATTSLAERVVGGALVGLIDKRVHTQLLAVPAPPELRNDEALLRVYRNGIAQNAAGWAEQALTSLRDCADHAARATDAAFVPWLDLCQAHMAELQRVQADAQALAEQLAREAAAAAGAGAPDATAPDATAPDATAPDAASAAP